jgi:hypothetical protein
MNSTRFCTADPHDRLAIMIRGVGSLILVLMMLLLFAAQPADAWRPATTRERAEIVAALVNSGRYVTGHKVTVDHIRVSTKGPWASARGALWFGNEPDYALAVFRRVGGRWKITAHSPGTAGVECGIGMPHVVQRDLGLGVC